MDETKLTDLEQRVLARISEDRWLKLAAELIKPDNRALEIPLDPDMPGGEEEAIAMLTAGKLEALGMSRRNLFGRARSSQCGGCHQREWQWAIPNDERSS